MPCTLDLDPISKNNELSFNLTNSETQQTNVLSFTSSNEFDGNTDMFVVTNDCPSDLHNQIDSLHRTTSRYRNTNTQWC